MRVCNKTVLISPYKAWRVPTWELCNRNIYLTEQVELSLHIVHCAVTIRVTRDRKPVVIEPVVISLTDDVLSNADLWCKTDIQIKVKDANE